MTVTTTMDSRVGGPTEVSRTLQLTLTSSRTHWFAALWVQVIGEGAQGEHTRYHECSLRKPWTLFQANPDEEAEDVEDPGE
jgi:hypothetical protein